MQITWLRNGKVVEKDSKKFISAIYGEYKEVKQVERGGMLHSVTSMG